MGYWNQTVEGESLMPNDTGLIWGDGPADILDDAIVAIREAFQDSVGRDITPAELLAGMKFSLRGLSRELPESHPFVNDVCTECKHLMGDHEFLVGSKWTCDDDGCEDSLTACARPA